MVEKTGGFRPKVNSGGHSALSWLGDTGILPSFSFQSIRMTRHLIVVEIDKQLCYVLGGFLRVFQYERFFRAF